MKRLKNFGLRVATVPFETSIALLLVISGIAQLSNWVTQDPMRAVLPFWEIEVINCLTLISGVFMIVGLGIAWRKVELAGLMFLLAVFAIRLLLFAVYFGINKDFAVSLVFDAAVLWAAIARIVHIFRGATVVLVKDDHALRH